MLGWVVWFLESLLCVVASYSAACALLRDRGTLERVVAATLIGSAVLILAITGCGVVSLLEPITLGLVAATLSFSLLYASVRAFGGPQPLLVEMRESLVGAFMRLVRDTIREREIGVLTLIPAALAVGISTLMVWYFRSWTWDPVWYHDPKIYIAIQEKTLSWFDTPNTWTRGNPQNIELFGLWNCIFQHDTRLDDSSQLPFLVLGALVVAAWARRVGASRPLCAAVAGAWISLPPIFLEAPSSHVDIAWNTFFVAAVYYMLGRPTRRDRWLSFCAWGLFLGSKYTGLFHLGLLTPLIFARVVYEVWQQPVGRRLARVGDVASSVLLVLVLGAHKYIQNYVNADNPMTPFKLRIKLLGLEFPGTEDPGAVYGAGEGGNATFFGAPGAFKELITSWYNSDPFYCPDVRHGGFGPAFRWLLLPCVIMVALDLIRGRNWRRSALIVLVFVQSLQVPVAYMSRFVIAAASAAVVAFALVHTDTKPRFVRVLLSAALVALTIHGYREGYRGFIVYPRYFAETVAADTETRAAMQIDTFLWKHEWALARERELNEGDVIVYDESVSFLGEFWNHDLDARVLFVSNKLAPDAYVKRVRELGAKWVGVQANSPQEAALRAAGGEFLFQAPVSPLNMHRMPKAR